MAVPAYFDPPSPEWQRLIAGAPAVGMIVFNPESGPGTAADPAYTQVIAQAQAAGIVMVGYVATSYGARPEADVIADINRYYDFYTLSGIYFAEGPMDSDCTAMEAMYHRMSDAVRARDAQAYLAVGTRFCPTYITFFDMMVQFARNWPEYQTDYTPPSWMPANSPQRFVHFVHSVPPGDAERGAVAGGRERRRLGVHHRPGRPRTPGACCRATSTRSSPPCARSSSGLSRDLVSRAAWADRHPGGDPAAQRSLDRRRRGGGRPPRACQSAARNFQRRGHRGRGPRVLGAPDGESVDCLRPN